MDRKAKNRDCMRAWYNSVEGREKQKERVLRYRAEGKCACGRLRKAKRLSCEACIAGAKERTKARVAACAVAGICSRCKRWPKEAGRSLCTRCFAAQRESNRAIKLRTVEAYGGQCVCCGETDAAFLTIDHINGGGRQHTKSINRYGTNFYTWLRQQGYPKDNFRLLCFNCNCGRRVNGGICPHEEQRAKMACKPAPKARRSPPPKPSLF